MAAMASFVLSLPSCAQPAHQEEVSQDTLLTTCSPEPLSHVGQEVADTLATYEEERDLGPVLSRLTRCNAIPEDYVIVEPGDFLAAVADEIRATQSRISISSYDISREHMRSLAKGLHDLHETIPDGGPYPLVQIMYSVVPLSSPSASDIVAIVREELEGIAESDWHFYLAVREYSVHGSLDYDHAKIVFRDGQRAVVGGHNLRGFGTENDDLTIRLDGAAAQTAGDVFDAMWTRAQEKRYGCALSANFDGRYECDHPWLSRKAPLPLETLILASDLIPALPEAAAPAPMNVFGLGRGRLPPPGERESYGDFSADRAVLAAFGSAEHSIRASQHSLLNHVLPNSNRVPDTVLHALWDAVLGRNVTIELAISDRWRFTPLNSDATRVVEELYEGAGAYGVEHFPEQYADEEAALDRLDCKLFVARYRRPGNDDPFNHSKFFIIDDVAYYAGSQNLYPNVDILGDLSDEGGRQLVNFGFLIDDKTATERIMTDYWNPIWLISSAERVLPEGRLRCE